MWVCNDWYVLICGLEGDEVLLEPPEHSPFLHQPPDDHKSVTQVDDYDGVNDANDNDDCSPKLVSFHHTHTFVDVPGKT